MFRFSSYPFSTLKSEVRASDNRGTELLVRAGFVRQEMAGAYHFLPLGLRTLERIKQIVREELDAIGSFELLLTSLGSREHWSATGRWDSLDVLFKVPAAEGREYALNPTHEEMVSPLMREFCQSYRSLPAAVYQFQNKFRNEARAKSGVLRGREFIMKDMYSCHRSQEDLDTYFEVAANAYRRIFERLGLGDRTYYTFASGGSFSKYSYEFQTELGIGEDEIHICASCGQSHNKEIVEDSGFVCVQCGHTVARVTRASEVGNIFKLGNKFSAPFDFAVTDETGARQTVVMGCYGIGISRTLGVIAEAMADDKGLVWPESIAPFTHMVLGLGEAMPQAEALARKLEAEGKTVFFDDRDTGFGAKIADAELMGIPNIYIVTPKTLAQNNSYEKRNRKSGEVTMQTL